MRRALVAAAVLALAAATPHAHAAPVGAGTTCGLLAVRQEPVAPGEHTGVLVAAVAAADTQTLPTLPLVTVRCQVTVNGDVADGAIATGTGPGAAVALGAVAFFALPGADVEVCTTIVVDGTVEHDGCVDATESEVPPAEVCDLLPALCEVVGPARFVWAIPQPVVI